MKRRIFYLLLAAALCVSAAAAGEELTWDQVCTDKVSSGTQLYVEVDGQLITSTKLEDTTYVRVAGEDENGLTLVAYSMDQETPLYGYVSTGAIRDATATVSIGGETYTVPEEILNSKDAASIYFDVEYGISAGGSYVDENGVEHSFGNASILKGQEAATGDAKWAKAVNWAYTNNGITRTFYTDDDGNRTEVFVLYMGLARSKVILNGKSQMVESWRLSWETEAPEDKVLAVIDPEKVKGQQVAVRAKGSTKSTIMEQVSSNRVVRVIKTGKNWTLVDINDEETPRGYVQTAVLDFYPNRPMSYTAGQICAAGRVKGSDPVWIRSVENGSRLIQFDLGEPLSVYCQSSQGWSEVDVGGYHAFIASEFVMLDSQFNAEKAETVEAGEDGVTTADARADAAAEAGNEEEPQEEFDFSD